MLKFRGQSSLFADFIGGDAVKLSVSLDRNDLYAVGINGVITAFPDYLETVFFQISDKVTPFDGHSCPRWPAVR